MRTNKKPYKSIFSELYVDAANYLAEFVCKRKAEKEEDNLPRKFWNHPKYKNLYIREISQARKLLKEYNEKAIINAIQSYPARFILSLRNKNLIPIIEEEQKKIKQIEIVKTPELKTRPVQKKHNPLQDL